MRKDLTKILETELGTMVLGGKNSKDITVVCDPMHGVFGLTDEPNKIPEELRKYIVIKGDNVPYQIPENDDDYDDNDYNDHVDLMLGYLGMNNNIPNMTNENNYIRCYDGKYRSEREYNNWIHNLLELYNNDPDDLTDDEIQQLINDGWIEEDEEDEDYYEDEDEDEDENKNNKTVLEHFIIQYNSLEALNEDKKKLEARGLSVEPCIEGLYLEIYGNEMDKETSRKILSEYGLEDQKDNICEKDSKKEDKNDSINKNPVEYDGKENKYNGKLPDNFSVNMAKYLYDASLESVDATILMLKAFGLDTSSYDQANAKLDKSNSLSYKASQQRLLKSLYHELGIYDIMEAIERYYQGPKYNEMNR